VGLLAFYLRERDCGQPVLGLDLDERKIVAGSIVAGSDAAKLALLLEAAEVDEQWLGRALGGIRGEARGIDAVVNHANGLTGDAAGNQIVGGAHAYRLKRDIAVEQPERALGEPDSSADRRRCLAKHGGAKEMVDEGDEFSNTPEWREKRNLVQILDYDIVVVSCEMPAIIAVGKERVRVASSDPVDVDAVQPCALRRGAPAAA